MRPESRRAACALQSGGPLEQRKHLGKWAEAIAAVAVVGAPLLLGAVHLPVSLGISCLGCLSLLLLLASLGERRLHVGWLAPALLAVNAATLLQLVPLPQGLVGLLAPQTAALYRAAGAEGWIPLSLDAAATWAQAGKWLGWICLFAVLQHRAGESKRARRRILACIAGSAAVAAVLGIGHWAVGEKESFLGLYRFAQPRPVLSSFGNPNHAAGFLNLGGLVALGLAAHAERTRLRAAWGIAFLLCVGASILTASRGGAMALLAGLLLLPILGWGSRERRANSEERTGWRSWLTVGIAVAVASGLAWWLYRQFPRLLREVATLLDFQLADEEGKLEAYRIAWDAALRHPLTGIGRGAFESVQALYNTQPWHVTFTHAENEPLQALAELGFPIGLLFVAALGFAWLGLVRRARLSWAEAGAAAGAFAILLQNLVDFSLHYAAGLALLALFAHRPLRELRVPRRVAPALAGAAILLVAVGAVRATPDIDDDEERLSALGADPAVPLDEVERQARRVWSRRPGWYLPAEVVAARAAAEGETGRALPWIDEMLRLAPQRGSGHLLAGEVLARLGRKREAIDAFRTAARLRVPSAERVIAWWPDDPDAVREAVPLEIDAALASATPVAKRHGNRLAIELLERLPEPDARVLRRLYGLRQAEGDHVIALDLAERLEVLEEKPAGAVALQARALARLGDVDGARTRYEKALSLDPRNTDALFGLAELELAQKNPKLAIEIVERVPVTAPRGAQHQRQWIRARAFRAAGELIKARDELRLLVDRVPENRWYRLVLGEVLLDLGRLDEAKETLDPLAEWPSARGAFQRLEKLRAEADRRRLEALRYRLGDGR